MAEEPGNGARDELAALKTVLKWEIQHLLQRLADTGEEGLVLTVSVKDGDTTELGSVKGQGFLSMSDLNSVKSEFRLYCQGFEENGNAEQSLTPDQGLCTTNRITQAEDRRKRRKKSYLQRTKLPRLDGDMEQLDENLPSSCDIRSEMDDVLSEYVQPLEKSLEKLHSMKSRRKRIPHKVVSSLSSALSARTDCSIQNSEYLRHLKPEPDVLDESNTLKQTGSEITKNPRHISRHLEQLSENQSGQEVAGSNQSGKINPSTLNQSENIYNQAGVLFDRLSVSKGQSAEFGSGNSFLIEDQSSQSEGYSLDFSGVSDSDKSPFHKQTFFNDPKLSDLSREKEGELREYERLENETLVPGKLFKTSSDSISSNMGLALHLKNCSPVFPGFEIREQSVELAANKSSASVKSKSRTTVTPNGKSTKKNRSKSAQKNSRVYNAMIGESSSSERKKYFKPISQDENPAETALLDSSKLGIGRYQCPMCLQTTRDRHDLKRHLRTHAKEKPYKCNFCGKEFTRKWDVENHMMKYHNGEELSEVVPSPVTKRIGKSKNEPVYEMSYEKLVESLLVERNIPVPLRKSEDYKPEEISEEKHSVKLCSNDSATLTRESECTNIDADLAVSSIKTETIESTGSCASAANGSVIETVNKVDSPKLDVHSSKEGKRETPELEPTPASRDDTDQTVDQISDEQCSNQSC